MKSGTTGRDRRPSTTFRLQPQAKAIVPERSLQSKFSEMPEKLVKMVHKPRELKSL